MRLIGMLDSPYVRRTAISLARMKVDFKLEQLSVFSTFNEFAALNPVVKAPTLITTNGEVLVDSAFIIEYAARKVHNRAIIDENTGSQPEKYYRLLGLSLVACEKTLQVIYERSLRPKEKIYDAWLERVCFQVKAAYREINREYENGVADLRNDIKQPEIVAAIAWKFAQENISDLLDEDYGALADLSRHLEETAEFRAYPYPRE